MDTRPLAPSRWELASLGAIALAILFGGNSLLVTLLRISPFSLIALAVLAFFQVATLRRNYAARSGYARLLVTRDITFVAAIAAAFAYVWHPAKWSEGATIAAVEFGLILEVLARVGPTAPAAIVGESSSDSSTKPEA